MNYVSTLLLSVTLAASLLTATGHAQDLRAKLAELEKLRSEKLISDAEYQDLRKATLQNFTQGSGSSSTTAISGAAATTGSAPDLSTPMKTAEAFERVWTAKDQAGLARISAAELKSQIAEASPERAEKEFSRFTVRGIGSAEAPTTVEGKEQCRAFLTVLRDGKEQQKRLKLVKEEGEWRVIDF